MSDTQESVSWYDPESVRATVTNGVANNIEPSRIAEYLAEREFNGIPLSRVERIVDSTSVSEDTLGESIDLSQPEATDAKPREDVTKQLAVYDLEYVSNREAARLIGVALEQFDGNTVRPPETSQAETDLVWNRQHMTVALRIVSTPSGAVDTTHIDALRNGQVGLDDGRSPSELAVVTNQVFTDEALAAAYEHDIHCFDAGHVEEWFRRARIPMDAVGTLLEDGETHDGPLTDLVELAPIPDPRKEVDPLEISRAFDIDSLRTPAEEESTVSSTDQSEANHKRQETGRDRSTTQDDPLGGTQSSSGKTGTLYADPNEDGDYDVFDKFVDDIKSGSHQSDTSADGKKKSQENEEESEAADTPSDSTTNPTPANDVDRRELLFDLVDAKQDGGERMSRNDVQRHCSYPVEYFEQEFGSLADALDVVSVEYSEDSQ